MTTIQQVLPTQETQFASRCDICKKGVSYLDPAQPKSRYCFECNLLYCQRCDAGHNKAHSLVMRDVLFLQWTPTSRLYKPTSTCVFCKKECRAMWQCRICRQSLCACCAYDRALLPDYVMAHLHNTSKSVRMFVAVMPPRWWYNERAQAQIPHPECVAMEDHCVRRCFRCYSLITLNSFTFQCQTCALEYSTAQRICAACFDAEDAIHKSQHRFVRVLQKLGPPNDKKTRLICDQCPDLASKDFHSRLKFEDGHLNLTMQISCPDAVFKRLWEYRICLLQTRPSVREHTPSPCCSSCGQFLKYNTEGSVCLTVGCKTSFCLACSNSSNFSNHEHQEDIRRITLYQQAAIATLGLTFITWRMVAMTTTRAIVTCSGCLREIPLVFYEGIFCGVCRLRGMCQACILAGNSNARVCTCSNMNLCYSSGLRAQHVFCTKLPIEGQEVPGFDVQSVLMPSLLPYSKLPHKLSHPFRLLFLKPGTATQPLKFALQPHSVRNCPPYEALSYRWSGLEDPIRMFEESGERFLAWKNMGIALLRMRYPDKTRVLWVDAICINQDDEEEKTQQVQQMHEIYQNASQVLVWLGPTSVGTDKAFKWMAGHQERAQDMTRHLLRMLKAHPGAIERWKQNGPLASEVKQFRTEMGYIKIPDDVLKPMHDLLQRDYFSRVWMIQEVFFAKKIQVYCGEHTIDWDTFVAACEWFCSDPVVALKAVAEGHPMYFGPAKLAETRGLKEVKQWEAGDERFVHLDEPLRSWMKRVTRFSEFADKDLAGQMRDIFKLTKSVVKKVKNVEIGSTKGLERDLLDCLVSYWSFKAGTDRDNVYALLNLVTCKSILPDYSKSISTTKVFKNVAFQIISESRKLDILTLSNCARETELGLPSWAPDWANYDGSTKTMELNQKWRDYQPEKALMQPYKASGGKLCIQPTLSGNLQNILSLSGYLVDQLVEVGPSMPSFVTKVQTSFEEKTQIISTLLHWDDLAMKPAYENSMSYQDAETAYLLTLCRGTFWVSGGDAALALTYFDQWRQGLAATRKAWIDRDPEVLGPAVVELFRGLGLGTSKNVDETQHFATAVLSTQTFRNVVLETLRNFTFGRTRAGLLVLGPREMVVGDEVALVRGSDLPLVVRRSKATGSASMVQLVGAAYIHGIMFGEWWDEKRCARLDFI